MQKQRLQAWADGGGGGLIQEVSLREEAQRSGLCHVFNKQEGWAQLWCRPLLQQSFQCRSYSAFPSGAHRAVPGVFIRVSSCLCGGDEALQDISLLSDVKIHFLVRGKCGVYVFSSWFICSFPISPHCWSATNGSVTASR